MHGDYMVKYAILCINQGILLNIAWKGSRSRREKRGNCCHRFNVNITAKCVCGLMISTQMCIFYHIIPMHFSK